MKKGCFIKLIIIITIFTAIIVYIIQNKLDELVMNPGKKFLRDFTEEQIREEFSYLRPSPEKDTLMLLADDYFANYSRSKDITLEEIDAIEKEFSLSVRDSIITPRELQRLKNIIESLK